MCADSLFTAEAQRNAEIRREEIRIKTQPRAFVPGGKSLSEEAGLRGWPAEGGACFGLVFTFLIETQTFAVDFE